MIKGKELIIRQVVLALTLLVTVLAPGSASEAQDENKQLRWNAPTKNEDGSTLTNLAGYKIYRNGAFQRDVGKVTQISVSALGLPSGTHRIWTTAYNSAGVESKASNQVDVKITGSAASPALTIQKSGSGQGTVTSSPNGISCGSTCSTTFSQGAIVTLTASANSTSTFSGWSGAGCSGTGSCPVTMAAAVTVTATFNLKTQEIAPQITSQPKSVTVREGATASFTCAYSPSSASVQWLRNEQDISGATFGTYTLATVTMADYGTRFRCRASNSAGSALSKEATLSVSAAANTNTKATSFNLKGRILLGKSPVSGLKVSNGAQEATTKSTGYFLFRNQAPGSYTLEVNAIGYDLEPVGWSNPVTLTNSNVSNLDYTATCSAGYRQKGNRCVSDGPNCKKLKSWNKLKVRTQKAINRLSDLESRLQEKHSGLFSRAQTLKTEKEAAAEEAKSEQQLALTNCEVSGQNPAGCKPARRLEVVLVRLDRKLVTRSAKLQKQQKRLAKRIVVAANKTQAALKKLSELEAKIAVCQPAA